MRFGLRRSRDTIAQVIATHIQPSLPHKIYIIRLFLVESYSGVPKKLPYSRGLPTLVGDLVVFVLWYLCDKSCWLFVCKYKVSLYVSECVCMCVFDCMVVVRSRHISDDTIRGSGVGTTYI